jgi:hypothetical protein
VNGSGDRNESWDLMSFLEAVTAELDRTRDLSRVKSEAGRPFTYTVGNMSLNLNVFPVYDGETVKFRTAAPNETGASELKVDLDSATAAVVEQTTKAPPKVGDVGIDQIPLDKETRDKLRNIGVDTRQDVERLRDVKVRSGDGEDFDFAKLADLMDEATRAPRPQIHDVVAYRTPDDSRRLRVIGEDLNQVDPAGVRLNEHSVEASVQPEFLDFALPDEIARSEVKGLLRLHTVSGNELRVRLR